MGNPPGWTTVDSHGIHGFHSFDAGRPNEPRIGLAYAYKAIIGNKILPCNESRHPEDVAEQPCVHGASWSQWRQLPKTSTEIVRIRPPRKSKRPTFPSRKHLTPRSPWAFPTHYFIIV